MSFIDPYVMLRLSVADPTQVTSAALTSAQSDLALEIARTNGDMAVLGGKAYLKVDLHELSSAMNDPEARRLFWEMRQLHSLIPYLEGGVENDLPRLIARAESMGTVFFAFASRWIARRLDGQLGEALASAKWTAGVSLARCIAKLHPASEAIACYEANAFFRKLKYEIDNLIGNLPSNYTQQLLRKYHLPAMLGVLNSLPPSTQLLRDEYALALGKMMMDVAATCKGETWTYAVMQSAAQITLTPDVSEKLKFMMLRVKEDSGIVETEIKEERKYKRQAVWAGIATVVVVIVKILISFLS